MATIFLSYALRDEKQVKKLESRLRARGHDFRIAVGTPPAGQWRDRLVEALLASDVLIPVLTKYGLASSYIAMEVGMARLVKRPNPMLLLPVLVSKKFFAPTYVGDYHCFHATTWGPKSVDRLAEQLHAAIDAHVERVPRGPRIFLSHRHKDMKLADSLVSLIRASFHVKTTDIRCTSVPNYKLSAGDKTSERLRTEIAGAEVVLGVLSPDAGESKYVLAELGAAWGCGVPTFPLLCKGATYEDVPEPLNERHSVSLHDKADCAQLVGDIARMTSLHRKARATKQEASAINRVLKRAMP